MAVRIGELLLKEKRITPEQLQEALSYQRQNGGKLGANLVKLGFVKDEEITSLLSKQYGVPSISLNQFEIDPAVIKLVPAETAHKYQIIPLSRVGATLTIAMTDPTNVFALDDLKFMTGYNVEPVVAWETAVLDAIQKYYGAPGQGPAKISASAAAKAAAIVETAPGESALEIASRAMSEMPMLDADEVEVLEEFEEISAELLTRQGEEAPVIKLVNVILMSAISKGASDIHIEPYEKEYRVRYRIDGLLYNVMSPPLKMKDAITSRVKIMAKLDIAEKRLPQDGRIKIRFTDAGQQRDIDFRVSCLPTLFGEKIVLRLLDRTKLMLDMTKLGFEPESLTKLEAQIAKPWGMVLVTGPTGSGKTNTLYSSISRINTMDTNIMTAEDPVEFNLVGVNQVQVRESIGLNFAAALRSFLRQDPNIILVGEIRDFETAEIAVKAALTGHLVLSTLHTNDAPTAVTRLLDLGVPPYLLSSTLLGVMAQRLVRTLCPHCRKPAEAPDDESWKALTSPWRADKPAGTMAPVGCLECRMTGYYGRIGLYEIMHITPAIRRLMTHDADDRALREQAYKDGMKPLRVSGAMKVAAGITTAEEVLKVAPLA